MVHIPYTYRHQEQTAEQNTKRRKENPGFVIYDKWGIMICAVIYFILRDRCPKVLELVL